MRIPGDVARALCRQVVMQWAEELPDGFEVTIEGTGSACYIKAHKNLTAEDIQGVNERGPQEEHVRLHAALVIKRFGTGPPVGSQRNRQRRMVANIAGEIKRCVELALDEPWPSERARVLTELLPDVIRVWFEDADGGRHLSASIAFSDLI